MQLVKAVAIALAKHQDFAGTWPEGATYCRQYGNYNVEFDVVIREVVGYAGRVYHEKDLEVEGMPYLEEYDDGDTVTKEEYEAFITENPNFYDEMLARRPVALQEIAALNLEVGELIRRMTALADEVGVELHINLGPHGQLNPNSDWDSSRC